VSSGHGRETGALPIGVLLAADGAILGNTVATLTPPGGVRYPSAWEQESAPPLPRREPRAAGRLTEAPGADGPALPRRRDLRTPGPGTGHSGPGQVAPRSPKTNSINRPQFPSFLPPGVVRLDEQSVGGEPTGGIPGPQDDLRGIRPRHDRSTRGDAHARVLGQPIRRNSGPATGSLDVDADLFTPAAERLARQTPAGGIAARHTPSAGLTLGHLQALPAAPGQSADGPAVAPGAYPRRRDLRRQGRTTGGSTGSIPLPPQAPSGLAFVPAQLEPAPCSGEIPLGTALPRRRDLRHGTTGQIDLERIPSTERTGAIAVGVARAAVMTMLVGVGYAVVSGHQLSLDVVPDGTGTTDAAGAMVPAGPSTYGQARAAVSEWDVRGEVTQAKNAAEKQTETRLAAARAATARVRAAKAAAAARSAQLAQATRDAQRNPKAVAKLLAAQRGWGSTQFTCLDLLWTRESGWNYRAANPSSGAYGIPQSLPGSKMASVGANWRTDPVIQIKWGLNYIAERYGTPCGAWAHSQSTGWY
jgi:hypothetical protein